MGVPVGILLSERYLAHHYGQLLLWLPNLMLSNAISHDPLKWPSLEMWISLWAWIVFSIGLAFLSHVPHVNIW